MTNFESILRKANFEIVSRRATFELVSGHLCASGVVKTLVRGGAGFLYSGGLTNDAFRAALSPVALQCWTRLELHDALGQRPTDSQPASKLAS